VVKWTVRGRCMYVCESSSSSMSVVSTLCTDRVYASEGGGRLAMGGDRLLKARKVIHVEKGFHGMLHP